MKTKIIAAVVLIAVVVFIALRLSSNKATMAAESKIEIIDTYNVKVAGAERRSLEKSLEMIGTINGNNIVDVVSEGMGKVVEVYAKVGEYKQKGSVLFKLDSELRFAAFKTAELNLEKAKRDLERFEALQREGTVAPTRLEDVRLGYQSAELNYKVAKREYENCTITAPISGVVTERKVDSGDFVAMGMVTAQIVDISQLKVNLRVSEKDAFKLKMGDPVSVTTSVYPGVTFPGKVSAIGAQADGSHTYPVEISLSNSGKNPLKSGMFGKVEFTSLVGGESLVIPRTALRGSVKNAEVFVVENGVAKLRKLTIGSTDENYLEVLQGLNDNEMVVVTGAQNLKDGSKVKIVQ